MPGTPDPNTPLKAGLSLKPKYFSDALGCTEEGIWFEVHPENYMVAGGPRLAWLEAVRACQPISLHGVSLSLAGIVAPDSDHLDRLAQLVHRIQPALVSEHLAWSSWNGVYYPDLLPFPRTAESLQRIAGNIGRVQDALHQRIALENPAHYLTLPQHELGEIDFLAELARRTGCGLLLDVNNVFVSARNLGYSAEAYIDAFPGNTVLEIHLAGHTPDPELGDALLIDSHDAPVPTGVWDLYDRLIARIGPKPTLIERDDHLPDFSELLAECRRARGLLTPPGSTA